MEQKCSILVVEDDDNLALNLMDNLEEQGYGVAVASNGQTALEICEGSKFDLALIDIKLPDVHGIDLIGKLNELSPTMEYIVITGYPSLETAIAAVEQKRIIAYEPKPLDMGRFISLIRQFTERRRAEEQARLEAQLLDGATDSIFLHDLEGRSLYVNMSAYKARGYGKDELMEMNVHDLETTTYRKMFRRRNRELIKRGEAVFESAHVCKDQSLMPVEVKSRIVESNGEKLVLSVARDITERKRGQEELERSYKKLKRAMEGTTMAFELATEMRDPYTSGHQRRVTKLACAIAGEMGVSKEQIEGLHMAGSIHDVGKMYVPSEILSKPGQLTDAEFCLIKVHPRAGHDILKAAEVPWPVDQIVLQHHERMNGSGYPYGISGEDILLEARILAVADVVEAMSSHRPYRPSFPVDKALLEITQKKGILYDCDAVDACMSLFMEKGYKLD
jgi:PAS domain S-box-containing protein